MRGKPVVQLHFNGSVFDLDEDQTVADVYNFMNNYTKAQQGSTWLKLADGGTVHIQVDGQPTFAVVVPQGYDKSGLAVSTRHYADDPSAADKPFDPNEV